MYDIILACCVYAADIKYENARVEIGYGFMFAVLYMRRKKNRYPTVYGHYFRKPLEIMRPICLH